MTDTAPRSNGWSDTTRRTLHSVRRLTVCTAVVIVLTVAGYAPGVVALTALTHVRGLG